MPFNIRNTAAAVDTAIRSRKTVRAFRPDPVPRPLVEELLDVARMAPSNFNHQPWHVYVLTGAAKRALSERPTTRASGRAGENFNLASVDGGATLNLIVRHCKLILACDGCFTHP